MDSIQFQSIPECLTTRNQWVAWATESRNGRPTKVPINPTKINNKAQSNNSATWGTFGQARSASLRGLEGVGFVFTDSDPYFGIDLDACRDPKTGELTPWAQAIVKRVPTYWEASPSGYGIKAVAIGRLPTGSRNVKKLKDVPTFGDKAPEIALYDRGRFWCMTGERLDGTPATCEPCQEQLEALLARLFPRKEKESKESAPKKPASGSKLDQLVADCAAAPEGQRSERDFALCAYCIKAGIDRSTAWARVQGVGKFAVEGERYFDRTWQSAEELRAARPSTVDEFPNLVAPDEWPTPQPLPDLSPVAPFDLELLPEALRPWVADIAERMQCPPDFPAVAAVIVMAALVGRKVGIRPKRYDDWLVVPNLWGGPVARPSLLKTPAIAEPLKVLRRLEVEAKAEFENAVREHAAVTLVAKAREKQVMRDIVAATSKGADAQAIALKSLDDQQAEPVRRRYSVNDATVEKLGAILNDNPNGVLVFRDELVGLLRSLDKDGQEAARSFYLEAWNGNGSFTYDRIGRGTLDIEACCISVLGGIQPGPLRDYLADVARGGKGDDGLVQRFQLLVWPDMPSTWRNVDRWPDTTAKTAAWEMYRRLDQLTADDVGATRRDDDDDIPAVSFDSAAQGTFDSWRAELEHTVRAENESDALLAHLGKYRSLVPSLALLFHLADMPRGGAVGNVALDRAIGWARYLETHARRLYGAVASPGHTSARALAQRIVDGDLRDGFSIRDVYRPQWSGLASPNLAREAAEMLTGLGWLREIEQRGETGRPSITYSINPAIFAPPESTAKTDKTPAGPTSVSFVSDPRDINSQFDEAADERDAIMDEADE